MMIRSRPDLRWTIRPTPLTAILVALLFCLSAVEAEENPACTDGKSITYDHLKRSPDKPYVVDLAHGECLNVVIENTLPSQFTSQIEGFKPATTKPKAQGSPTLEPKTLSLIHNRDFGGYFVHIRRNPASDGKVKVDGQEHTLNDATLTVFVKTMQWSYEFAGAFTISDLTDPVFALKDPAVPDPNKPNEQIVVRDRGAEDESSLGIAAFIHVFHERWPHAALTFGLGISEGSETSYFLGPSWKIGDKAALTLGYVWGSTARLPSGVSVGDRVDDSNLLNNLGTRVDNAVFLGLSYSFIDPGDRFRKPFAGSNGGSASPATDTNTSDSNSPAMNNSPQGDSDSDGIVNLNDNCKAMHNPDQADHDADGIGDACDNCPGIYNADQADQDNDGRGDACPANSWNLEPGGTERMALDRPAPETLPEPGRFRRRVAT
jgi:hypothetical protein